MGCAYQEEGFDLPRLIIRSRGRHYDYKSWSLKNLIKNLSCARVILRCALANHQKNYEFVGDKEACFFFQKAFGLMALARYSGTYYSEYR